MRTEISGTFTVWAVWPETMELRKPLFTGHMAECKDAFRTLMDKGWPFERLSIVDHFTGRHCSVVIE